MKRKLSLEEKKKIRRIEEIRKEALSMILDYNEAHGKVRGKDYVRIIHTERGIKFLDIPHLNSNPVWLNVTPFEDDDE